MWLITIYAQLPTGEFSIFPGDRFNLSDSKIKKKL